MRKTTLISTLILSICLLTAAIASAQSRYFSGQENGFDLFAGYESGRDFNGLTAGLGYSFGAKFDLGLAVSRTVSDEYANAPESYVQFTPYAGAILLSPDNISNLGIEIEASYGMASFKDDWLDQMNLEMTGNIFAVGASLYRVISYSQDLTVLPAMGLFRVDQTIKYEDIIGASEEYSDNNLALIARMSFVFTENFHITPSVISIDDHVSWRITVGRLIH